LLRRVRCKVYRETWSRTDPEMKEREVLPEEYRRGLVPKKIRIISQKDLF